MQLFISGAFFVRRMLRQQADELEREIRLLMEKRRDIAHTHTG